MAEERNLYLLNNIFMNTVPASKEKRCVPINKEQLAKEFREKKCYLVLESRETLKYTQLTKCSVS